MNQRNPARELQRTRLPAGPAARAALLTAQLPQAYGDGMRSIGNQAEAVSATLTIEGSSGSAGVTELALSMGGLAFGEGEPGIPVARSCTLKWLSASFMADTDPGGVWTLHLWHRPEGAITFSEVAIFEVETA